MKKKDYFNIGVVSMRKKSAIVQARMIAWQIKNLGIKNVRILPIVYKESRYNGIESDKIIIDEFKKSEDKI